MSRVDGVMANGDGACPALQQAKDSGVAPASSDRKSSVGGATPVGGAHQFTQVVLKKNDPSGKPKGAGRSKWSQKKDLASDGGSSEHGSETSESALSSGEFQACVCLCVCVCLRARAHTHTHTHK